MKRANYTVMNETADRVTLRDDGPWDQHPTITNACEDVVAELFANGTLKSGQRLFYYDSEGEYDELLIQERSLRRIRSRATAAARVKAIRWFSYAVSWILRTAFFGPDATRRPIQ